MVEELDVDDFIKRRRKYLYGFGGLQQRAFVEADLRKDKVLRGQSCA